MVKSVDRLAELVEQYGEQQVRRWIETKRFAWCKLVIEAGIRPEQADELEHVTYISEYHETSEPKICPKCGHVFQGKGWKGIDVHWRARHEDVMPYEEAWSLIRSAEAGLPAPGVEHIATAR